MLAEAGGGDGRKYFCEAVEGAVSIVQLNKEKFVGGGVDLVFVLLEQS